jgi:hypothetical protein
MWEWMYSSTHSSPLDGGEWSASPLLNLDCSSTTHTNSTAPTNIGETPVQQHRLHALISLQSDTCTAIKLHRVRHHDIHVGVVPLLSLLHESESYY